MATMAERTVVRPETETAPPDSTHGLIEALKARRTLLTRAGIGLAVVAVGVWFFMESGRRKAQAAAEALDRARTLQETGNLAAASAEFQRISAAYSGTEAGYQALLALNETRVSQGQTQIAVDDLRAFLGRNPPDGFAASGYGLLGTALENQGKYDVAAQAYAQAATLSAEPYRKVDGLLNRARALRLAGKGDEALTVLRSIVSDYTDETPGVAEARVRLAELTRGTM